MRKYVCACVRVCAFTGMYAHVRLATGEEDIGPPPGGHTYD